MSLGANFQAVAKRAQVGGVATVGSTLGLFQLEVAGSTDAKAERTGVAAAIDYRHDLSIFEPGDFRLAANLETVSAGFSDAFAETRTNPDVLRTAVQLSGQLGRYTLSTGAAYTKGRGRTPDRR